MVDPASIGFPNKISLKIMLNNGIRKTKIGRITKKLTKVNTMITSKFGNGCISRPTRMNRLNVPIKMNMPITIPSNENE